MNKPSEILESTTEKIRGLIAGVLEIEREYENKKNIHLDKALEKQIGERICSLVEKEIAE